MIFKVFSFRKMKKKKGAALGTELCEGILHNEGHLLVDTNNNLKVRASLLLLLYVLLTVIVQVLQVLMI